MTTRYQSVGSQASEIQQDYRMSLAHEAAEMFSRLKATCGRHPELVGHGLTDERIAQIVDAWRCKRQAEIEAELLQPRPEEPTDPVKGPRAKVISSIPTPEEKPSPACVLSLGFDINAPELPGTAEVVLSFIDGRGQDLVPILDRRVDDVKLPDGRVLSDRYRERGRPILDQVRMAGARTVWVLLSPRWQEGSIQHGPVELILGQLVHAGLNVVAVTPIGVEKPPMPSDEKLIRFQPSGEYVPLAGKWEPLLGFCQYAGRKGRGVAWRFVEKRWSEAELARSKFPFGKALYFRSDLEYLGLRFATAEEVLEGCKRTGWERLESDQVLRDVRLHAEACVKRQKRIEDLYHRMGEAEGRGDSEEVMRLWAEACRLEAEARQNPFEPSELELEEGVEVVIQGEQLRHVKPDYLEHLCKSGILYGELKQKVRQWLAYEKPYRQGDPTRREFIPGEGWTTGLDYVVGAPGVPDMIRTVERTSSGHWGPDNEFISDGCEEGHLVRDGVREVRKLLRAEDPRGKTLTPTQAKAAAAYAVQVWLSECYEDREDAPPLNWQFTAPWAMDEQVAGEPSDDPEDAEWHESHGLADQDEYDDLTRRRYSGPRRIDTAVDAWHEANRLLDAFEKLAEDARLGNPPSCQVWYTHQGYVGAEGWHDAMDRHRRECKERWVGLRKQVTDNPVFLDFAKRQGGMLAALIEARDKAKAAIWPSISPQMRKANAGWATSDTVPYLGKGWSALKYA